MLLWPKSWIGLCPSPPGAPLAGAGAGTMCQLPGSDALGVRSIPGSGGLRAAFLLFPLAGKSGLYEDLGWGVINFPPLGGVSGCALVLLVVALPSVSHPLLLDEAAPMGAFGAGIAPGSPCRTPVLYPW